MVPDTIERGTVINASPERVRAVLTEPAFPGRWFGSGEPIRIDLRPGGLPLFDQATLVPGEEAAVRQRANSLNWPGKLDHLRTDCEHDTT